MKTTCEVCGKSFRTKADEIEYSDPITGIVWRICKDCRDVFVELDGSDIFDGFDESDFADDEVDYQKLIQ